MGHSSLQCEVVQGPMGMAMPRPCPDHARAERGVSCACSDRTIGLVNAHPRRASRPRQDSRSSDWYARASSNSRWLTIADAGNVSFVAAAFLTALVLAFFIAPAFFAAYGVQQRNHFGHALLLSEHPRRVVVLVHRMWIGAARQEQLDHLHLPLLCRPVQRPSSRTAPYLASILCG